jgi:type I restriction enzyme, S subunit
MKTPVQVHLGDVASFVRGINFKPKDVMPLGTNGTVACMRTKNVQSELDLTDVWGIDAAFVKRDDQYLRHGDILISSANSWNLVGKCCWIPDLLWRSSFGGFVSVLRADVAKIFPRYLFYWLASTRIQATVRSFGQQTTNISNLNIDRCLKLLLPLPSLSEQRRIAEVLDRAEALRAKRRAAIAQLDTLTQSIFLDMFGDPATNPKEWPMKGMGDLFAASPIFGTMIPPGVGGGSWLSLRVANIQNWQLDLTDQKHVELPQNMVERHSVKDGDLLLARAIASQEHLGKAVIVYPQDRKWAFDSHLMRLRFARDKAEPNFIRCLLLTPGGRSLFLKASRRSAVQFNINTKEISALHIPVPPLQMQFNFAKHVHAVERFKETYKASLSELNVLFASLQHRAFRGEL